MTNELPKPLPAPLASPDGAHYWAAAAEGRLEVQYCSECATHQFPPGHLCRNCGAEGLSWRAVSGRGRIHTFSIVYRAPTPAFRGRVPYTVALIDLDEGPRMMTNIVGAGALECTIGDTVEVCFEDRAGGAMIPQFRLVGR
ncbi:MAG: Zn-ribbon domain-containing OB-fold protein [Rhodospirillaceae bacterium]